jgi:6-methylsalicylate decarboxylase
MSAMAARAQMPPQKAKRHGLFRACSCCCVAAEPASPARRNFLASGIAALGFGASSTPATMASAAAAPPARIDVHHHYLPPAHAAAMGDSRVNGPPPKWTVELSFADMEKAGVSKAVLSLMPPGLWFGDPAAARKLARECNDFGAQLVRDHPGRFGLFAALPLPDTGGSLREIEYALDVLKADGIGLFTSYGDKYLGDPAFAPVFEELNRRKAVVYTHPIIPVCCTGLIKGVSNGTIEFATDTTRTIASLIFGAGGTAFRCPDIKFIWSHSGGTLPFLIGRFIREQAIKKDARMPDGPVPIVQRYFYEIAQGTEPGQFAALLKLVPTSQLTFGSDFPFREAIEAARGLEAYGFSAADRVSINRQTALRLLPRLAG